MRSRFVWLYAVLIMGQNQAAKPDAELTRGWDLLAQGNTAGAAALAEQLLQQYPKNANVAELLVQSVIARQGATAGLNAYEKWLGTESEDNRDIVRRVAFGFLRELARDKQQTAARNEALEILVDHGDLEALSMINAPQAQATPPILETALQASRGDERAVKILIDQLNAGLVNRAAIIGGLARTHSRLALKPLTSLLDEPNPNVRTLTARALGELGFAEAVPALKPLLNDQVFDVRLAAAEALLKLKDQSGLAWLRELERSEYPGVRLTAVQATKTMVDGSWMATVQGLTRETDPEIRRQAAVLIAPHDPATAKATLQGLLDHENPAEREAVADSYAQVTDDIRVVRRYLRVADPFTRIHAAARILEITR